MKKLYFKAKRYYSYKCSDHEFLICNYTRFSREINQWEYLAQRIRIISSKKDFFGGFTGNTDNDYDEAKFIFPHLQQFYTDDSIEGFLSPTVYNVHDFTKEFRYTI